MSVLAVAEVDDSKTNVVAIKQRRQAESGNRKKCSDHRESFVDRKVIYTHWRETSTPK
jgi:hypothetical protein